MNWRFQWLYRGALALLVIVTCWTVWATAQTNSVETAPPAPPSTTTNSLTRMLGGINESFLTFGLDRIPFLNENEFLGEPLWKYFASLLFILLALCVSKLLDWVVGVWLKRWTSKTHTKYDDLVLDLLRGPVKLVSFVIFLHIGLNLFRWPPAMQNFLSKALIVVVAISITYVAIKLADLLLGVWRERHRGMEDKLFSEHLYPVIRKSVRVVLILVAVLLTADNLGIKVTSILAGLSIGGLALGLAAQDTVANLFGAVAIFLDKPFSVGDRIKIEGVDGTVETIGLRSTRVRNLDGHLVTIPNKTVGNAIITNITRRPAIRTEMNLGLTYDTPTEKVKRATAILDEIFRAHPQTSDLIISFNRFADFSLNIFVVHVWRGTDMKEYFAGMQELNLAIKQRFDAERIEFAFPTQTIYTVEKPQDPSSKLQ